MNSRQLFSINRVVPACLFALVLIASLSVGSAWASDTAKASDVGLQAGGVAVQATAAKSAKGGVIKEGAYLITSASSGKAVAVKGGSIDLGAKLVQAKASGAYAQRFYIEPVGKKYYRIINVGSGLALSVIDEEAVQGFCNKRKTRLWRAAKNGDGTFTFIQKGTGKVLGVKDGSSMSGASIVATNAKGKALQRFKLKAASLLRSGATKFTSAKSRKYVLDVASGSAKSGAKIQCYRSNGTIAQRFVVASTGSNAFTLRGVCSGRYVAPKGAGVVQRKASYRWKPVFAKEGKRRGVMLRNASNSRALGLSAVKSGAAATAGKPAASLLQTFLPSETRLIKNGYYHLANDLGGRWLDITGGDVRSKGNVQIYEDDGTSSQFFAIKHVSRGYYCIVNCNSGKALDVEDGSGKEGANVWQFTKNGSAAQLWKARMNADGRIVFTNKASKKLLSVEGDINENGANVVSAKKSGAAGQNWRLVPTVSPKRSAIERARDKIGEKWSATNYMIAVDLTKNYTTIFRGSAGSWRLYKCFHCSTGAPSSPTVTGDYTVGIKGYSFNGHDYTCYYYTQFYGDYLFHSVVYDYESDTIQDGRIGMNISAGCVRLKISQARWIYNNIPSDTHVYVYY